MFGIGPDRFVDRRPSLTDQELRIKTGFVPGEPQWLTEEAFLRCKIDTEERTSALAAGYIFKVRPPVFLFGHLDPWHLFGHVNPPGSVHSLGHDHPFEAMHLLEHEHGDPSKLHLWKVTCYKALTSYSYASPTGAIAHMQADELEAHGIDSKDGSSCLPIYRGKSFKVKACADHHSYLVGCFAKTHLTVKELRARTGLVPGEPKWMSEDLLLHHYGMDVENNTSRKIPGYLFSIQPPVDRHIGVSLQATTIADALAEAEFIEQHQRKNNLWKVVCHVPLAPYSVTHLSAEELHLHRIDPVEGISSRPMYENCVFKVEQDEDGSFLVRCFDRASLDLKYFGLTVGETHTISERKLALLQLSRRPIDQISSYEASSRLAALKGLTFKVELIHPKDEPGTSPPKGDRAYIAITPQNSLVTKSLHAVAEEGRKSVSQVRGGLMPPHVSIGRSTSGSCLPLRVSSDSRAGTPSLPRSASSVNLAQRVIAV